MSRIPIAAPSNRLAAELGTLLDQIEVLSSVPATTATVAELGPLMVQLETAQNQLAGISAQWTTEFETAGGPEEHAAPSLNAWARRELRVTPYETRRRTRRAAALAALPDTSKALLDGRIGLAHVDAIALGVHQLGPDVMAAVELALLEVAETCDADAVKAAVRKTQETLDPDAADAAYIRALERRDITINQVGDGFDVRGFLDPLNGAAFKTLLQSRSVKTSVDDDRTAGQRRADTLGELSTAALEHGLPTDRGLRPQVFVTVPAERLDSATRQQPPVGEPAALDKFGEISDKLLSQFACDCAITPVIVDPNNPQHVLDVGRTQRLATLKQRQAIFVQQGGVCFNPGCDRTRLEIHHMIPWSLGGQTNMADLRGYCSRCHTLIHLGLLTVTPDGDGGWTHHTKHRVALPQHKRRAGHLTRVYLQALTHGGKQHALAVTQDYRRSRGHTVIRT